MNTQNRPDIDTATPGYRQVDLTYLHPSPINPRQHFDGVEELAENIARQGVLVPLLVRPRKNVSKANGGHSEWTSYEIVDGERRYRAAKLAGTVTTLPAIVRELPDDEVLEIQLLSAIQRQALTPLEEARGYRRLLDSNPAKYSAAYIADRISRSERYVVDRMRLLALIPALQQLLDAERIGVAHAELLAKLKPEDQERAADPGVKGRYDLRKSPGGLWTDVGATLDFDLDDEAKHAGADPYAGLKPVTVKELEAWIARHVRFDVQHFAETAPLEFGETAIRVEAAAAQPGRGKKVIQITTDYRPDDDVRKDGGERIYSQLSWKRADGTEGTSRGGRYGDKAVDSPTCLHSVLGVVVTGPGYGTAFPVCIARDKCEVHWKAEIKEREQRAKAATSTGAASKPAEESWEARQKRETEQRRLETAAFAAVYPQIEAAILEALPPTPMTAGVFAFLWGETRGGKRPSGTPDTYLAILVRQALEGRKPTSAVEYAVESDLRALCEIAAGFGVDPKPYQAAYKQQLTQAKKAAAAPATTTPAKKAVKTTAKKKGGRS